MTNLGSRLGRYRPDCGDAGDEHAGSARARQGDGASCEIRLVPDPATFRVLPYADNTAAMTTDMIKLDGQPWEPVRAHFEAADRGRR